MLRKLAYNHGWLALEVFISILIYLFNPLMVSASTNESLYSLEEITVTAAKREENRQNIPIAVTVIDPELLSKYGSPDLLSLSNLTPSLTAEQRASPSASTFFIRGLGTSVVNAGLEPSVGVYIDDVYQSRPTNVMNDLLDLERIEIIRGPESTLFGKNSSAGVISLITKKPSNYKEGNFSITAGDYGARQVRASIAGPITKKINYRASMGWHERDGFYESGRPSPDLNDRNRYAVRGQIGFSPYPDLSFLLSIDLDELDEGCCGSASYTHLPQSALLVNLLGGTPVNQDPFSRKITYDNPVAYQHDQLRLTLKSEWQRESSLFTAITAWQDFEMQATIDGDFGDLNLNGEGSRRKDRDRVFSQEFRLRSSDEGDLQWITGFYYSHQRLSHQQNALHGRDVRTLLDGVITGLTGGTPFVDPSLISLLEQAQSLPSGTYLAEGDGVQKAAFKLNAESVALYGRADWQFSEKWSLGTGLRWSYEEKQMDANYLIDAPFSALDLSPTGAIAAINPIFTLLSSLQYFPPVEDDQQSRHVDKILGDISLQYQWRENLNIYSSLRRGYKSGGYQLTSFIPDNGQIEFDEEIVDMLELGVKFENPARTLQANLATFIQKVDGYQVLARDGNTMFVSNASDVVISGAELETSWRLSNHLTLRSQATYLDAEYKDFEQGLCLASVRTPECDMSGESLARVPHWTSAVVVDYSRQLNHYLLNASIQNTFKGSRYAMENKDPKSKQGSYQIMNASVSVTDLASNWSLVFWGRNIGDEEYTEVMFDSVYFFGDQGGYPGDPRAIGVTLMFEL